MDSDATTPRRRVLAALGLPVVAAVSAGCGGADAASGPAPHRVTVGGLDIAYREVPPTGATGVAAPPMVLFLHGASYTSAIWQQRGILDAVGRGQRAVAIDLPGKGASEGGSPDPVMFLEGLLDALGERSAVTVSPSASGSYSLPYLAARSERVEGFVPIAPMGGDSFEWPDGAQAPPTMVVVGERDEAFASSTRRLAGEIPGARLEVIADAGHAAYDDQPEAFTRLLTAFLHDLRP